MVKVGVRVPCVGKGIFVLPKHKISWVSILPHGVHLTPGEMTDPTLVQNLPEFSKDPIFQDLIFTYGLFEEKKKTWKKTFRIVDVVYWDWLNYRTSSMSQSNKIHVVYNHRLKHCWQVRSALRKLHSRIEKNNENEAWVSLPPQSVFEMLQIWGWALVPMDLKKTGGFRMSTPIHLWPRSCSV